MDLKYIILQVKIWEIFFKISPIFLILSAMVLYFFDISNFKVILYALLVFLVAAFITWWIWVIYTIAVLSIILYNSNNKLMKLTEEIIELKNFISSLKKK
jgi:hypothetical protein